MKLILSVLIVISTILLGNIFCLECRSNSACPSSTQYCKFESGTCKQSGAIGVCTTVPQVCYMLYKPVCGCDGRSYSNQCWASYNRTSVQYSGQCTSAIRCNRTNDVCKSMSSRKMYCHYGSCNSTNGQCAIQPEVCPKIYKPVCGCNSVTYGNDCEAAAAGQTVSHEGACSNVTTCTDNSKCSSTKEFCKKSSCGSTVSGKCMNKPDFCPEYYKPVCGCDGKTYSNECFASMSGVNIKHEGACNSKNDSCSVTQNDENTCGNNDFCSLQSGTCLGNGHCTPKPRACNRIYKPVCSCNGKTFGNACEAAASGQNVLHQGAC